MSERVYENIGEHEPHTFLLRLSEYQAVNLRWALQRIIDEPSSLNTGDWVYEVKHAMDEMTMTSVPNVAHTQ